MKSKLPLRVAVTGSRGFIGQHVCQLLEEKGFSVVRFSRSRENFSHQWSLEKSLEKTVELLCNIDVVIHLAAYIPKNYEDISEAKLCFELNGLGTLNLLNACHKAGVSHFIYSSSCALYSNNYTCVDENSSTIPSRAISYLASKLAGEVYVGGFSRFLKTTTLRLSSVYGPNMHLSGLVPICVQDLIRTGRFIAKDGNRFRTDIVHVQDVAESIHSTICTGAIGTINIASGVNLSPYDLAVKVARVLNIDADNIEIDHSVINPNSGYPIINIERARNILGFKPRSHEEGIMNYIESLI